MYTGRRRRYYSKKYYRNRLFAPSMKKANMPNYYQMKGRIIQQTPSNIKNSETELMNQDRLEKYFDTLVKYKYPFPSPPVPPPLPGGFENFIYNFHTSNILYSELPDTINIEYLYNNYVSDVLGNLPDAPTGFQYGFQLNSIYMFRSADPSTDTSRFTFTWNTSLTTNPISIITKTVDTTYADDFLAEVICIPRHNNQFSVTQINYTLQNIVYRFSNFTSSDESTVDDVFYPLLSSQNTSETYDDNILISHSGSNVCRFNFYISIFLYENSE